VVVHACNPSYLGGKAGGSEFKASPDKVREILFQKLKKKPNKLFSTSLR
jgi:hypothetical protein